MLLPDCFWGATAVLEKIKLFFAFLFLALITGGCAWLLVPPLWNDFGLKRADLRPAADAKVVYAFCKPMKLLLSSCDIKVRVGGAEKNLDFLSLPGLMGRQNVEVLSSPSNPSVLTTSLALDQFWSRFIVALVLLGSMTAILGGGTYVRLRS